MAKKRRNKQRNVSYSTHDLDCEKQPRKNRKNTSKDILHATKSPNKVKGLSKRQIKKNLFIAQSQSTGSDENGNDKPVLKEKEEDVKMS